MELLPQRGFGGNVLRGWINDSETLVDVPSLCRSCLYHHGPWLIVASPFLARTLKTGYSRLQGLVREAVVGSKEDVAEGYVGPEVVLMLQSIASVQQTR